MDVRHSLSGTLSLSHAPKGHCYSGVASLAESGFPPSSKAPFE